MKTYRYYKELNAATFDHSRLPFSPVVFLNLKAEPLGWTNSLSNSNLHGIRFVDGEFYFEDDFCSLWRHCAEVIERYPRDVPQGVTPLPEDKPFLAYVDLQNHQTAETFYDVAEEWNCYAYNHKDEIWEPFHGKVIGVLLAIDVSTEWAAENFPEIVEAMEYESVYGNKAGQGMIGHKLGNKTYDLEWNEIGECSSFCHKDEPCSITKDGKCDIGEEPPDFERFLPEGAKSRYHSWLALHDAYDAGYARGEWEVEQSTFAAVKNMCEENADKLARLIKALR